MNLKLPVSADDVEALVRVYMEIESRGVDIARNERAIAERLARDATVRPRL